MNRLTTLLLFLSVSMLNAQEPNAAQIDTAVDSSLAIPMNQPAGVRAVSSFYTPPAIEEIFERYYQLVDTLDEQALTRRFVQVLLDSLAGAVQADFDSLAIRARAFEVQGTGYTQRFYRSPLTRDRILGEPISEQEAANIPHFQAIYDPQGYLVRVSYVEPRQWRTLQQLLAQRSYQSESGSPPLVRYFRTWDVRRLEPLAYTVRERIPENEPYLRVIYDQQDNIQSVQSWDAKGALIYSIFYDRTAADNQSYARLEFANDSTGSMLDIHPYLYLRDWSIVRPGWKVAFTRDDDGNLASTQVFDQYDQLSYYYTYSLRSDTLTNNSILRGTALSDTGRIERVFALVFDENDQLIERSFYTTEGELLETTVYEYQRRSAELLVTTRNAAGIVTSRQRFINPPFWD